MSQICNKIVFNVHTTYTKRYLYVNSGDKSRLNGGTTVEPLSPTCFSHETIAQKCIRWNDK